MDSRILKRISWFLLLALLLASCQPSGISFTPVSAAVAEIRARSGSDRFEPTKIQVRQTIESETKTFVLLTYQQKQEGREDKCIHIVATIRNRFGLWAVDSSGGGCIGRVGGGSSLEPEQPIEISSGNSGSNSPTAPGYSYVDGLVHDENIHSVRITWDDGTIQEMDVIIESLLAIQAGVMNYQAIEGLNANRDAVFLTQFGVTAPGKQ